MTGSEAIRIVSAFGGRVVVRAAGAGAESALLEAEVLLRRIHRELTLFEAGSPLFELNADPRPVVASTPGVLALARAVGPAARLSGGLVDATVGSPGALRGSWRQVATTIDHRSVIRPPGVRIDSGGLTKGMAADAVARRLSGFDAFTVECLGDLRVGGTQRGVRPVRVADPFGGSEPVTTLRLRAGAVATSGTTRRSGHLLDPRTGEPADTGVVQATAIAPSGFEAEVRAKGALLAGPDAAFRHLPDGGVLVLDTGDVRIVPASHGLEGRRAA